MFARFPRSCQPSMLRMIGLLLLAQRPRGDDRSQTSDAGLSLIECLVAIVVISITVVAITPPIFLATATRIQSRRADQANQIAQGEIDRIRVIVERGNYATNELPAASTGTVTAIAAANAGTATSGPVLSPANCATRYPTTTPTPVSTLIRVDVDGDCTPEYVMQVFRTTGVAPSVSDPPFSFDLGVRVYAYSPGESLPTLGTQRSSLVMGTGRRDSGVGIRRPLAVLYSKLARNDSSRTLDLLR
ncbi:type IV pilus modification PilV family protein [Pantanalinema sp. GBBB05]|uniref:type IV pilus modification PilV family protein n=1 Tax=Pantanalinema sp. GBBB05 TaxID=2604139 RepID=UPI001D6F7D6E|nr:prepilin-type N-terminal cleavage/methylation domain-containing protein [Pantanalinema sp. GBBB05]